VKVGYALILRESDFSFFIVAYVTEI